jgi:hypothetical protein
MYTRLSNVMVLLGRSRRQFAMFTARLLLDFLIEAPLQVLSRLLSGTFPVPSLSNPVS